MYDAGVCFLLIRWHLLIHRGPLGHFHLTVDDERAEAGLHERQQRLDCVEVVLQVPHDALLNSARPCDGGVVERGRLGTPLS